MRASKIIINLGDSMDNRKDSLKILYSWPIVILATFALWPLGLFLLYLKCTRDKKAFFTVGKIVGGLGYFWLFGFIILLMLFKSDPETTSSQYAMLVIIFGIPSLLMILYSRKIKKQSKRYKLYLVTIVNKNEYNLNNISVIARQPVARVKKDLQKMINTGYLSNAYIDHNKGVVCIINVQSPQTTEGQYAASQQGMPQTNQSSQAFTCQCCGANNSGGSACDYCGTVRS